MSKSQAPDGIKPLQPEFDATRDEGPLYRGDKLIKSKKRVADHGEVFTPPWLVEKMLDLVKGETERIDSRFLEPACGSGNFLVPILQRKLAAVEAKYGKNAFEERHYALLALTSCYGIELLADNIAECRGNMLEVFAQYLGLTEDDDLYHAASHVLSLNLIHGDAMKMTDADGGPIMIVEWGYIGKGKFQRRDFSLKSLTEAGSLKEERQGYAGQPSLFATLGQHPVFQPIANHAPMNVRELAALDGAA
ncbi:SAM-dependent methyltransferase [Sphingomonas sp. RG327]|uniref:SAM-dependent methyltransferase n=1 Tax=Sphingomonas anseongensis TaxID=2908207 RepID=A0ABT0REK0_9SPHN|nr:DNA methyltransferase [Sphingomonas anseongensis]MCL6678712.1 SAM-dependent methyltransferase [Sphingomonas anseongensis]